LITKYIRKVSEIHQNEDSANFLNGITVLRLNGFCANQKKNRLRQWFA
jgi:hypothetical protein